jgi:putative ABC transport system ATP-binding protein
MTIPTATNPIAIQAEQLTKTFGTGDIQVRAVRGVDLEVRHGEVVLVMGPSGSGKTTLLSMLGGMLRPTSGRIAVAGVDLATLPESKLPAFRARRFGFVFQDFNLLSALSAQENVEFALNLAGQTGRRSRDTARRLLEEFGLGARLGFKPGRLSGGEKQRVAIARAIANEPAVILADEPTANLDSKIGHDIARLLRRAASEQSRAVVIVSHDTRLKDIANRTLWLEDGQFRALSEMATDPVCGMAVEREGAPHYRYEGETFFFCSTQCREEFAVDPRRFQTNPAASSLPDSRPPSLE